MNKYNTSSGERISQATIDRRRSLAYRTSDSGYDRYICEGCLKELAINHSHIVSQKRCKELGKAELCYEPLNWFRSCGTCHEIWEAKKSGKFGKLKNIDELMFQLSRFDPDEHQIRLLLLNENY